MIVAGIKTIFSPLLVIFILEQLNLPLILLDLHLAFPETLAFSETTFHRVNFRLFSIAI